MTHSALIERIEKAEGPSPELDAHLAVIAGDVILRGNDERGFAFFEAPMKKGDWAFISGLASRADAFSALGRCLSTKHYTSSIDAAVALAERVLPGWDYGVRSFGEDGAVGTVWKHGWHDDTAIWGHHSRPRPRPALALCLATLRALQSKGEA